MGTDVYTMASKSGPADSKLALAMKRIEAVQKKANDDLTVEERAIEAEKRFYAIADKLKALEGPDRYTTSINFITQNRDSFVEYD